jgi:hypothetical protein
MNANVGLTPHTRKRVSTAEVTYFPEGCIAYLEEILGLTCGE